MVSIDKMIKKALLEDMNVDTREYLDPGAEEQADTAESPDVPVTEILPPRFLSVVASKRYNSLVQELNDVTGKVAPPWGAVMHQVMQAMSSISQIELPKKKELEKLAVDTILSLPEWRIIRDRHIKKGWLKIEATIGKVDFQKQMDEFEQSLEEDEPEEVAESEVEAFELIKDFKDSSELRRDLANFITQGEAATGFHTYKLIKDKIDNISPKLYNLYKLFVVGGLLNYFKAPLELTSANNAIASVEIVPMEDGGDESGGGGDGDGGDGGGGGYIIRAGGPNFVLLMHEIIKGLYDYLAVDVGEAKLEDLRAERLHTNAGPGIAKIFRDRFLKVAEGNIDDLQYFPFVLRLLYGCDPETEIYDQDLKDIVTGRPAGMQILKDCLDKVKQFYLNGDEIDNNTEDNIGDDTDNDTGDDWKNG